jgi:phosphomannomutase
MTALFCEVILDRKLLGAGSGAAMLYDLRSSRIVPETLRARGAVPIRSRVGHAFMKAVMRERGACFGGELSGHYYFQFPSGYIADDGAAAMMLLLEALDARKPPLSRLWRPYQLPPERRDQPPRRRRSRRAHHARARTERCRRQLDGLTVTYPDWWFNLRPSNTEPLLRRTSRRRAMPRSRQSATRCSR